MQNLLAKSQSQIQEIEQLVLDLPKEIRLENLLYFLPLLNNPIEFEQALAILQKLAFRQEYQVKIELMFPWYNYIPDGFRITMKKQRSKWALRSKKTRQLAMGLEPATY
jgi:hypothetical protein